MLPIFGQAPQGYSSCIVGRLTGASRGNPRRRYLLLDSDTQSHRPALTPCKGPSSIIVGARSSFCSLVRHSEKTGRLFSTGWISVLKENKRGRIQSQTVNTWRENRGQRWWREEEEALGDCNYVQIMQQRPWGRKRSPSDQPAASSVIDWLQDVLPSHTRGADLFISGVNSVSISVWGLTQHDFTKVAHDKRTHSQKIQRWRRLKGHSPKIGNPVLNKMSENVTIQIIKETHSKQPYFHLVNQARSHWSNMFSLMRWWHSKVIKFCFIHKQHRLTLTVGWREVFWKVRKGLHSDLRALHFICIFKDWTPLH